jgi:hypothetical protein
VDYLTAWNVGPPLQKASSCITLLSVSGAIAALATLFLALSCFESDS